MNFKEIITFNRQNVKNIIKKITKEENEDLEQEVYLKALKSEEKYKEQGRFQSWINMIARNVSFDYLKSRKFYSSGDMYLEIQDKKPNPESILISLEKQRRILTEINKLKPRLKKVIILTEFYNLSYQECAEKLKCPVGTIKSRIYNAKKELSKNLKDLL